MSGRKKIYEALLDGAGSGLSGEALHAHVIKTVPKATSKKIVRASLLALSDPELKDGNILQVIYALAIKHRLDPVHSDDGDPEDDDDVDRKPSGKVKKKAAKSAGKPSAA